MDRQSITERALLIAMCNRDVSECMEEHSLMSSVCKALDSTSNVMNLSKTLFGDANYIVRNRTLNVLNDWCEVEPIHSPFTKQQMRKTIADAMRLARKELRDERNNM